MSPQTIERIIEIALAVLPNLQSRRSATTATKVKYLALGAAATSAVIGGGYMIAKAKKNKPQTVFCEEQGVMSEKR